MSTHDIDIGFYKETMKILFQLSPNIIKYAPYLFFWQDIMYKRGYGPGQDFRALGGQ